MSPPAEPGAYLYELAKSMAKLFAVRVLLLTVNGFGSTLLPSAGWMMQRNLAGGIEYASTGGSRKTITALKVVEWISNR